MQVIFIMPIFWNFRGDFEGQLGHRKLYFELYPSSTIQMLVRVGMFEWAHAKKAFILYETMSTFMKELGHRRVCAVKVGQPTHQI